MAVVVAGVEEVGFFLLKVINVELNNQRGDESDEGCFERGGEAAGDALEGLFHERDFGGVLECLTKAANGLA